MFFQEKLTIIVSLRVQSNKDAARDIYEKIGAKEKLTMIYAEEGNVDQLVAAAGGKPGEQPNYTYLLQVCTVRISCVCC